MDDVNDLLEERDNNSDYLKILEQLTSAKHIRRFSQLNDDEIKKFTKLMFLAKLLRDRMGKKVLILDNFIDTFLTLRFNLERKSRKEFVDSFSSERTNRVEKTMLHNVGQNITR